MYPITCVIISCIDLYCIYYVKYVMDISGYVNEYEGENKNTLVDVSTYTYIYIHIYIYVHVQNIL